MSGSSDDANSEAVWSLFKNYVHTQARERFRDISNLDQPVKEKMDTMEWLAQNVEFISSPVVLELIEEFTAMIDSAVRAQHPIVYSRHSSKVV
jgi:hypothetical protein